MGAPFLIWEMIKIEFADALWVAIPIAILVFAIRWPIELRKERSREH